MPLILILVVIFVLQPQTDGPWTRRIEPFRVVENIYYVGTEDLASYLITTPSGHILIETGVAQNADAIATGIRKLGFSVNDVRILLTTQAHMDHAGAHARIKEMTNARVLASAGDKQLLEDGGASDYALGDDFRFTPVKVDDVLEDGEVIRLGNVELTAHVTAGHTQGATSFTTSVGEGVNRRRVLFAASTSVNPGARLVGNTSYPQVAEDYQRSFEKLAALRCDIFLAAHGSAMGGAEFAGKRDERFFKRYLGQSRAAFDRELAKQKRR